MSRQELVLLIAVVVLFALGSVSAADLTVVTMPHAGNVQWVQAGVEAYLAQRGEELDIQVIAANDWLEQIIVMVVGGNSPDVIFWYSADFMELVGSGLLEDLAPYVAADNLDLSQYVPSTLDAVQYRDALYGLPRSWSAVGLLYNENIFSERGVPYPEVWTWEDLLVDGRKLTWDENGDGETDHFAFSDFWAHFNRWPMWVLQAGGRFWNDDMTECLLNSPEAIEGMQFMYDLYFTYNIAPKMVSARLVETGVSTTTTGYNITRDLFERGHIAAIHGTRYERPAESRDSFAVTEPVRGPAGAASIVAVDFMAMMIDSKNKELAWDFIKFMSSEEGIDAGMELTPKQAYHYGLSPIIPQLQRQLAESTEMKGEMVWINVSDYAVVSPVNHPAIRLQMGWGPLERGMITVDEFAQRVADQTNSQLRVLLQRGVTW